MRIELAYEDPEYEAKLYEVLDERVRSMLEQLKKWDPQIEMNGFRNVWIVKPNCKCEIIQSCRGGEESGVSTTYTTSRTTAWGERCSSWRRSTSSTRW